MDLQHIDLTCLSLSPANMRAKGKVADLANILPSVRARGVLVPLIVRQSGTADRFEIVAGKRRYQAALVVAEESGVSDPLPCAVMAAGDDAAALEISLMENIARLDPDEVTRWDAFVRLVRLGRSIEDIALTFGLTEVQVKRTLALGNLLPRIRGLYQAEKIDAVTVRHLTLASKARQREWLAMVDDAECHAPTGQRLKAWLFGGASIATGVALFDLASYPGEIVTDLFGEERFFADADSFWTAQLAAVEERAQAYRDAGWSEVVVLEVGTPFHYWEHERCTKRKGGRVYVALDQRGEVTFHEGYVSLKEARALAKGEAPAARPPRPEATAALNDYIDLHRHAAVRAALLQQPSVALSMTVAHMIAGSSLWTLRIEPQRSANDAVTECVASSAAEEAFDCQRRAVLALLGLDADTPTVTHGYMRSDGIPRLFQTLLALSYDDVLAVMAVVMGETLDARSEAVDALGLHFAIDMRNAWQPDTVLLDLVRDREVMTAIVAEVAGEGVAQANAGTALKVQRQIVRNCLDGVKGRAKVEGWVPKWLVFPPLPYTERGGVGSVRRSVSVAVAIAAAEPEVSDIYIEPVREAA